MDKAVFIFGLGYSGTALARRLLAAGWQVAGTTRSPEKAAELRAEGIGAVVWPGDDPTPALAGASHILMSVGPDADGDPVMNSFAGAIAGQAAHLRWLGYLSTTGVYGHHGGEWVDEATALAPTTLRGQRRVAAERGWQDLSRGAGLPLHIFRLAGIYGPGRGPYEKVRDGTAQLIIKPGQFMSRIHVDDIARVLHASMERPRPGAIYNVCDDDPSPPQDTLLYAAQLLGLPPPPVVAFDAADMTASARSFYSESKRVSNDLMKRDLGVTLAYPSYREGLAALLDGTGAP